MVGAGLCLVTERYGAPLDRQLKISFRALLRAWEWEASGKNTTCGRSSGDATDDNRALHKSGTVLHLRSSGSLLVLVYMSEANLSSRQCLAVRGRGS